MRLDQFTVKAQEALQSAQTMYGKALTPTVGNSPQLIALSIARVRDQTSFQKKKMAHPLRYYRSDPVGAPCGVSSGCRVEGQQWVGS